MIKMTENIPVFNYVETFPITGRGTLYCGPIPFNDPDRTAWKTQKIIVDGVVREIAGIEMFMKYPGPVIGESVGLLLKEI